MTAAGAAVRVSVVICTRDRPGLLADALTSVLACEEAASEVIVVDQSSDGRSRDVVDRMRHPDRDLVYVAAPPRGLAAARNLGAARASGDVVAYTDDDCLADRGWVRGLAEEFRAAPDVAAVCGRSLPLVEAPLVAAGASVRTDARARLFRTPCSPWRVGNGCNMAFRRSALRRVGPFDERLGPGSPCRGGEEADLLYRLLKLGLPILYSPRPLVYHRQWRAAAPQPALAHDYGAGVGAFAAKHVWSGDLRAARTLCGWAAMSVLELVRAAAARQPGRVRAAANQLCGLGVGVWRMTSAPVAQTTAWP